MKKKSNISTISKRFKNAGSITKIQNKINTQGQISSTIYNPTTTLNESSKIYEKLLKGKTINIDSDMYDIILTNRYKLKHRFSAKIIIDTNKGEASLTIDGILPEETNDIYNFITPEQTYTSQELKNKMQEIKSHYEKNYGSIGGSIITPPDMKVTIKDVKIETTFA